MDCKLRSLIQKSHCLRNWKLFPDAKYHSRYQHDRIREDDIRNIATSKAL